MDIRNEVLSDLIGALEAAAEGLSEDCGDTVEDWRIHLLREGRKRTRRASVSREALDRHLQSIEDFHRASAAAFLPERN